MCQQTALQRSAATSHTRRRCGSNNGEKVQRRQKGPHGDGRGAEPILFAVGAFFRLQSS